METIEVKTNINCASCVARVKPFLDAELSIQNWEVDTTTPDKTLKVSGNDVSKEKVKEVIGKAGFVVK